MELDREAWVPVAEEDWERAAIKTHVPVDSDAGEEDILQATIFPEKRCLTKSVRLSRVFLISKPILRVKEQREALRGRPFAFCAKSLLERNMICRDRGKEGWFARFRKARILLRLITVRRAEAF